MTRARGFTLVELLVVLTIVAVAAGAVSLAVGRGAGDGGQAEARRLAARIELAADRAMIEDRAIALDWTATGYRFLMWDGARWVVAPGDALAPRALPPGMVLAGAAPHPAPIGGDGGAAPIDLTLGGWAVHFDGAAARAERLR